MKIKEKDFVEIEYTAKVKDTEIIFDLTDEALAKKLEIHQSGAIYGSRIICIGRDHILPVLEKALVDKEENSSFSINLTPDQAFGKKIPALIRTISTDILLKQKIDPYPGLQIYIAGRAGTIRSVSRGRTMVDFNHPLAGRNVTYDLKILTIIKESEQKLRGLVKTLLGIKDYELEKKEKEFLLKSKKKIPVQIQKDFIKEVAETIPEIKVNFA